MTEMQAVRAALVERRDAFQRAIDAFDAALGMGVMGALASAPSNGQAKRPRHGRTDGRTDGARTAPPISAEPP